jgi:hypothetical protein
MSGSSEGAGSVLGAEQRRFFRDALREARATAQRDAEGFGDIVHVLERLGAYLRPGVSRNNGNGLWHARQVIAEIARQSPFADEIPDACRSFHTPFETLYEQVKDSRNDAFHEGAVARHLTGDAIILALILEDALISDAKSIGDYMIRQPVCAELWQPLSFIRQIMLVNSFSHLPVKATTGQTVRWSLLSDTSVAQFTRTTSKNERFERLRMSLANAIEAGLELREASILPPSTTIEDALAVCNGLPILVADAADEVLLGFATPFDLL